MADSFDGNRFVRPLSMWLVGECVIEMYMINLYSSVGHICPENTTLFPAVYFRYPKVTQVTRVTVVL